MVIFNFKKIKKKLALSNSSSVVFGTIVSTVISNSSFASQDESNREDSIPQFTPKGIGFSPRRSPSRNLFGLFSDSSGKLARESSNDRVSPLDGLNECTPPLPAEENLIHEFEAEQALISYLYDWNRKLILQPVILKISI